MMAVWATLSSNSKQVVDHMRQCSYSSGRCIRNPVRLLLLYPGRWLGGVMCFVAGWLLCSPFCFAVPRCFTHIFASLGSSCLLAFLVFFHFHVSFSVFPTFLLLPFFVASSLGHWLAYVPSSYSLRLALHGLMTFL